MVDKRRRQKRGSRRRRRRIFSRRSTRGTRKRKKDKEQKSEKNNSFDLKETTRIATKENGKASFLGIISIVISGSSSTSN